MKGNNRGRKDSSWSMERKTNGSMEAGITDLMWERSWGVLTEKGISQMGIAEGCLGYVAYNEVQFIWEGVLNNKLTIGLYFNRIATRATRDTIRA